jgi:hypothetical protein
LLLFLLSELLHAVSATLAPMANATNEVTVRLTTPPLFL